MLFGMYDRHLRVLSSNLLRNSSLFRLYTNKTRVKNIASYHNVNWSFANLTGILHVDTMGIKTLGMVCQRIARCSGKPVSQIKSDCLKKQKKRSSVQLVTPQLQEKDRCEIKSIVGIYLTSSIVSWAKLNRDGHVICWNVKNLDADLKKLHPTKLLTLARGIISDLPDSDIYVMEDALKTFPSQQQINIFLLKLSLYELKAMLLTLINESVKTENMQENVDGIHRLYYLRSQTYARLFRALVGSERVSVEQIVLDIICSKQANNNHFSPIMMDHSLVQEYLHKDNIDKENMGQSLLIAMAFMDLIVKKNEESLKYISPKRYKVVVFLHTYMTFLFTLLSMFIALDSQV